MPPDPPVIANWPPPVRSARILAAVWALVLAIAPAARAADARPATSTSAKGSEKTEAHRKRSHRARHPKAAAGGAHEISDKAPKIVAFPTEGAAVTRAFADQRREQLDSAEKVARGADQRDRWHAVLFELRDLDSRADTEACFWRVLAYLRLGDLRRAHNLRKACDIAVHDNATMNSEDAAAASLQPTVMDTELRTTGDSDGEEPRKPARAVENPAPYTGPAPARVK